MDDGWRGAMVTYQIGGLTRHPCLDKTRGQVSIIKHNFDIITARPIRVSVSEA